VKARVKLAEGMAFLVESGSGHAIVVDGAPDIGGRNLGPRPMELVLMGTGACTDWGDTETVRYIIRQEEIG